MADFKAALVIFLETQPAILARVQGRVIPMFAPSGTPFPYLTYQRIDFGQTKRLGGTRKSALVREDYQINVWGDSMAEAEETTIDLRQELDEYVGLMGGVFVQRVMVSSILDGHEEPTDGQTQGKWQHTLSVDCWYTP